MQIFTAAAASLIMVIACLWDLVADLVIGGIRAMEAHMNIAD